MALVRPFDRVSIRTRAWNESRLPSARIDMITDWEEPGGAMPDE